MGTCKRTELDLGRLVILVGVDVEDVRVVLLPLDLSTTIGISLEELSVDTGWGSDVVAIHDLTGAIELQHIEVNTGFGNDVVDGSAQQDAGLSIAISGGWG